MKPAAHTDANQLKLTQAQAAWADVLARALQRGFHGSVSLELVVQDGSIQLIKRRWEQHER